VCGVCGDPAEGSPNLTLSMWDIQHLSKRFGALPDATVNLTTCSQCHDELSEFVRSPDSGDEEGFHRDRRAMNTILDDIPEESLFLTPRQR